MFRLNWSSLTEEYKCDYQVGIKWSIKAVWIGALTFAVCWCDSWFCLLFTGLRAKDWIQNWTLMWALPEQIDLIKQTKMCCNWLKSLTPLNSSQFHLSVQWILYYIAVIGVIVCQEMIIIYIKDLDEAFLVYRGQKSESTSILLIFVSFLILSWLDGFHQSKKPSLVSRSFSETSGCTLSSWVLLWKVQVSKASVYPRMWQILLSRVSADHGFATNGGKAHILMFVMKRWITLDLFAPCRALARGMVWRCLWDRRQVSSSDVSQWRTASLWAAVQLCPEKRHSHTGRFVIKHSFAVGESKISERAF